MKKKRLLLPKTLRFPSKEEFPKGYDVSALKKQYNAADIVPGYKVMYPEKPQAFKFFAQCNVNIDDLWDAVEALSKLVPDESRGVIGIREDQPYFGRTNDKSMLLKIFKKYELELLCDPYLEFGLASADDENFSEVFVSYAKYLNFWGNDVKAFQALMKKLKLPENNKIRFIDEFPLISEALPPPAKQHEAVFAEIKKKLAK